MAAHATCLCFWGCLALWKGWSGLHPVATHVHEDNACLTWSQCGNFDFGRMSRLIDVVCTTSICSHWAWLCCTTVRWHVDCEQQAPMSRKTDKELEEPCYRYAARYSQHAAADAMALGWPDFEFPNRPCIAFRNKLVRWQKIPWRACRRRQLLFKPSAHQWCAL